MKLQEFDFKFDSVAAEHIFFTSDLHFYHTKIIKYCQRPFDSIEDMNKVLISNWNSKITNSDIVFILGDFCFGGENEWESILNKLNGVKYFIYGNHDYKISTEFLDKHFVWHGKSAKILIDRTEIYLQHFPYLCFDGAWMGEKATWQLFGHCHSKKNSCGLDVQRLKICFPTQYDVGIDNNNYTPISYNDVKEIIQDQMYSLNLIK